MQKKLNFWEASAFAVYPKGSFPQTMAYLNAVALGLLPKFTFYKGNLSSDIRDAKDAPEYGQLLAAIRNHIQELERNGLISVSQSPGKTRGKDGKFAALTIYTAYPAA
ncbi:MAG: hypothetical protein HYT30_00035 [Parcubacteria group bacterium]|nr:hypothetical protein [Parcubacteria group bacterium]